MKNNQQLKALLIKNFNLLKKQKGSLFCQFITPIICLSLLYLIQYLITNLVSTSKLSKKLDVPIILNFPYLDLLSKSANQELSCDQMYLFSFEKDTSQYDKDFFGVNDGEIWSSVDLYNLTDKGYGYTHSFQSKNSSGMLTSQRNIFQKKCLISMKMTPYFIFTEDINKNITERLNLINAQSTTDSFERSHIPDGAYLIKASNKNELTYRLSVNDNRYSLYHRNNGVSKINNIITVSTGALYMADILNKAYIRKFLPDLFIVSAVQIMPFTSNTSDILKNLINFLGSILYPVSISLLMPMFMYTIVLEKEFRLIEIMKINGLKMSYYWTSLFLQNFIIYSITILLFVAFGNFIFKFFPLNQTSFFLQVIIYFGWGVSQNGLAFFYQAFISNSKTSTSKYFIYKIYYVCYLCILCI